ncbi:inositol monophosphatase family protein [Archangium sp.]|uniref:inositol monophosphatase family protein n=1 Tax=Archangium sp. TaxID=1872627 RepID=UPI002D38BA70|nr:inositol monophosphatase family protein [Archangium sp.]HYO51283.1 inositol monophosphatase family protein [Archangium sp.]
MEQPSVRELQPIIDAVRLACELCRRVRASLASVSRKKDSTPVTLADYGAQALLCRTIRRHFPEDAVVAEESGEAFLCLPSAEREKAVRLVGKLLGEPVIEEDFVRWLNHGRGVRADRTWFIDPIDGTEGFIHGRTYAVCVGTLVEGEPVDGVIGAPVSPLDEGGTLFFTDGGGAWAEPLAGGEPRALHVSDRADPRSIRVVESYLMGRRSREIADRVYAAAGFDARRIRRYDGMLKYALVAAGAADVFIRGPRNIRKNPHKSWDHVAGAALVGAAGGRVTGLDGRRVDFTRSAELRGTLGLIASNGHIHPNLVEAMARAAGEEWGFLPQLG